MIRTLLPYIFVMPSVAYALISLFCGRRFFRTNQPVGARDPGLVETALFPGITILKPVKGMDAGSYENFSSFCHQEYGGDLQLVFAAASADDPVIPVIRQLTADYPQIDISLVINPAIHGPNYKVSNLINAFPKAKHDIIVVCDSDIRVSQDYLRSVSAHFADPKTGLVTSLYRTSNVHGIATAIEATGFTAEMIPNVMVALQLEGLSFALGASMAVRREALESIGGFEVLADYLADDYQLGNKIHLAGWQIVLDRCFVESMMKNEELLSVLSRQLRWSRTMRVSRPGGYMASGITLPFLAVLLVNLISAPLQHSLLAILILYTTRLAVTTIYSRCLTGDNLLPRWLWLIPIRDMLGFFTWALAFLGNRVEWRGSRFRLKPGGKIEEIC
jgi:ceramide glucosyltransferase